MSDNRMSPIAYIEAAAELQGIDLSNADLDAVERNFRNFMDLAAKIEASDEDEPLNPVAVYRP